MDFTAKQVRESLQDKLLNQVYDSFVQEFMHPLRKRYEMKTAFLFEDHEEENDRALDHVYRTQGSITGRFTSVKDYSNEDLQYIESQKQEILQIIEEKFPQAELLAETEEIKKGIEAFLAKATTLLQQRDSPERKIYPIEQVCTNLEVKEGKLHPYLHVDIDTSICKEVEKFKPANFGLPEIYKGIEVKYKAELHGMFFGVS